MKCYIIQMSVTRKCYIMRMCSGFADLHTLTLTFCMPLHIQYQANPSPPGSIQNSTKRALWFLHYYREDLVPQVLNLPYSNVGTALTQILNFLLRYSQLS